MEIVDTTIVVSFENSEHGMCPISTEIKGFEIAGEDKLFYPATGLEKAGKIIISSPSVQKPVAVRYAYKNYAEATLFNAYGIPASPFRTDNW
jgi:sialate O-acetylesterase